MKVKNKIMRNLGWLVISDFADKVLSFVIITLLARYLGTSGFGIYSFVISFVLIFGTIADFGFSTITTRDLARKKSLSKDYISNTLTLKIILGLIIFTFIMIFIKLLGKSTEVNYLVYLAGIWVILTSFNQFFASVFRAYEKMVYESIVIIIENILRALLVVFIVFYHGNLSEVFFSYIFATSIAFIVSCIIMIKRFTNFSFKFDLKFFKYLISESWPIMVGMGSVTLYAYVNSIFLSIYKTDAIVGLYNAAYRIVLFLLAGRKLLAVAIYPALSRLYITSKEKLKSLIMQAEKISIVFAVPATFAAIILAEKIITFVYGKAYTDGAIALQITIFQMLFLYSNLVFTHMLNISGNQRWYMVTVSIGALLNLILNFILIPKTGMIGAGISTIISEFLVLVISYAKSYTLVPVNIFPLYIKPIIASLIMSVYLIIFHQRSILELTLIGLIIYFLALLLIRGIKKEDFHLV